MGSVKPNQKADDRATSLDRLMPNIGGPSSRKTEIIGATIDSTLNYVAPIWQDKNIGT